jgi:hypothetical protein
MFYFFSKTLNYLLTPIGWLVAVLLLAFYTNNLVRRRRMIGVGLAILWVFGNPVLMNELTLRWEYPIREISAVRSGPAPALPIAVLLTGGMVNISKKCRLTGFCWVTKPTGPDRHCTCIKPEPFKKS